MWSDLSAYRKAVPERSLIAIETSDQQSHAAFEFEPGDSSLFGSETTGLSSEVLATIPPGRVLKLPMIAGSRSLNLSNAAAVALYEAWRQLEFKGAE